MFWSEQTTIEWLHTSTGRGVCLCARGDEQGLRSAVKGQSRYKEWKLYSKVITQTWERYGRVEVDLITSQENGDGCG